MAGMRRDLRYLLAILITPFALVLAWPLVALISFVFEDEWVGPVEFVRDVFGGMA